MNFYIKNYSGSWYAWTEGSDRMFLFKGLSGEDQFANVKVFAQYMLDGEDAMISGAQDVFSTMQTGEVEDVIQSFLEANELWFAEGLIPVYESVETFEIATELEAAAEALLVLL